MAEEGDAKSEQAVFDDSVTRTPRRSCSTRAGCVLQVFFTFTARPGRISRTRAACLVSRRCATRHLDFST